MKTFILALTALLTVAPAAHAARVEPVEFALEYCRLRNNGVERGKALTTAVAETFDEDKKEVKVYVNGESTALDSYLAAQAISLYCPKYLN